MTALAGDTGAIFSADRVWRYALWRKWDSSLPPLMVVGLNPSTADETVDDPTVRRCLGYAREWGFGSLRMLNAFSYRATDPSDMFEALAHMKPSVMNASNAVNLDYLETLAWATVKQNGAVLAAWGNHGAWMGQDALVTEAITRKGVGVACLGKTNTGQPKHPLYLRRDAKPVAFLGDGGRLCATDQEQGVWCMPLDTGVLESPAYEVVAHA